MDPSTNISEGGCSGIPTLPNLPALPIINLDAGLDPKIKCMLQKMAGYTNLTDDKITLPRNSTTDDLFQKMLRKFNGVDAPQLTFKYNPTLTATSGAYANGTSLDGGVTYQITVGEGLVQSSNIRIMTTLAHELTHVFMLNELFQLNMIEWMPDGQPKISGSAATTCTNNNYFSNDDAHFFAELLCLYIENPTPQLVPANQWMHDLFGTITLDMPAFTQNLANYIKDKHDWNSESAGWSSAMQSKYGSDWKSKVSMNLQMDAIRQTNYFTTWSNLTPEQFHIEVKSIIDNGQFPSSNSNNPPNKNCN